MPFQIIRNDITRMEADAIVNTVNPYVQIGRGVELAIYNAAGKEKLFAERKKLGILLPGDVGITPAFQLNAKYIIHVSGPFWQDGKYNEEDILKQCYYKALELAVKNNCHSIAFPLLSTGTYKFPKELGISIAIEVFTNFLKDHEIEILLVVFGKDAVSISGNLVKKIIEFIDDDYVAAASDKDYDSVEYAVEEELYEEELLDRDYEKYISDKSKGRHKIEEPKYEYNTDIGVSNIFYLPRLKEPESLENALKKIYTDSFEKHLQQLINKKGLKNSEVYATANISKQYFSKLLKGKVKPSKEKMLALAVGLRLNIDETIDFLRIAGYALSPISQTDKVVEYFIKNEDYNVIKIDIVLFDFGLEPLSN